MREREEFCDEFSRTPRSPAVFSPSQYVCLPNLLAAAADRPCIGGDDVELRCFLWENDNRFMDEFLRVTSKLLSFAMLLHFDPAQGQGCRRVGCSRAGDAAYAQHSLARAVVLPGCAADGDRAAIRCCDDAGGCRSICSRENAFALTTHFTSVLPPSTCVEPRFATYAEAVAECQAHDLRLCATSSELDRCCKTGCQADKVLVWVACTTHCSKTGPQVKVEIEPPPESQQGCSPRSMRGLEASSFYCLHGHWYHGIFCNRCDIGIQNAVLRAAREAEPKALHVVLAMGTNDGSDLEHTTSASWYKPDHMLIHGFEIGHGAWAKSKARFESNPEVHIHCAAVTDVDGGQTMSVGGNSSAHTRVDSTARSRAHRRNSSTTSKNVPTVALHAFVRRHKITQVTYTLIDTEGHEATIVSGMRLDVPENRAKFPIFQYEVWSPYANGWSSRDLIQRLEQWGYRLYSIGSRTSPDGEPVPTYALPNDTVRRSDEKEAPVLLRFNSSVFTDPKTCVFGVTQAARKPNPLDPSKKSFGSNTLAVAESAVEHMPWLKAFLDLHELRSG